MAGGEIRLSDRACTAVLAPMADHEVTRRLRARRSWRGGGSDEFIAAQIEYSKWLRARAGEGESPIEVIDTTDQSVSDRAEKVSNWIRLHLS